MEKKIDIKIIIIAIISIIAIVEGIIIIKSNSGAIKEKEIIGTWESENKETSSIELYEGGTGKTGGTPLTWEIKENILNITENYYNFGTGTKSYKIENKTMTSVDGEKVYHKTE